MTLTLFDDATIEAAFQAFHAENPHVYLRLRTFALDLVKRGHHRIGIGMLFEVLRWEWAMTTDDPSSTFKLNNSYRSRYSRLLMEQVPELEGVFETRRLTAP